MLQKQSTDLKLRPARTRILFVRVTDTERETIASAAAKAGLTIADFMREAARVLVLQARRR